MRVFVAFIRVLYAHYSHSDSHRLELIINKVQMDGLTHSKPLC